MGIVYHRTWFRDGANKKIEVIMVAVDLLKLNTVSPLSTLFNRILSSYKLRLTPNKAKRYIICHAPKQPAPALTPKDHPFRDSPVHVVRQSNIDNALNDLFISSGNFRSLYFFCSKSRDDSTLLSHRSPEIIRVEES